MRKRSIEQPEPPIDAQSTVFLRMSSVMRLTGLGRSTIYRLVAEGKFPAPVRLSVRAVAWRRVDIQRWCAERESVRPRYQAPAAPPSINDSFITQPISSIAATMRP